MKLEILRFNSSDDFTSGILFDVSNNKRKFLCYTLEDQAQTQKVWGETRIPAGTYNLSLRKEGGFHTRYAAKFGSFHQGMIHVDEVTATYIDDDGQIIDNKSKDYVMNIPEVTKIQEDIMHILSTEIKSLKTEVKALRQTIILKGLSPR